MAVTELHFVRCDACQNQDEDPNCEYTEVPKILYPDKAVQLHVCPDCYLELSKMVGDWLDGKNE